MRDEDIVLLDPLTGLAHRYDGVGITGPLLCECPLVEEDDEELLVVSKKHIDRGVYEYADCIETTK